MNTGDIHRALKLIGCVNFKEEEINTSGTDFITANYNKLLNYCRKLTQSNNNNDIALLSNVFIGIKNKELSGDWKATYINVDPIVYTIIKNYAKNTSYTKIDYDNRHKLDGEVSVVVYKNQDEPADKYHDILDTILDGTNFTEELANISEVKLLINKLRTDKDISEFGRQLIYKTISEPELMIDSIDVSIYSSLSNKEQILLYNLLQLIVKIKQGRDKNYEQIK